MAAAFWAGPIAARDRALLGGPSAEELGYAEVLGWTDLSPAPAPLQLLKNGDRQSSVQKSCLRLCSVVSDQFREFAAAGNGDKNNGPSSAAGRLDCL